MNKLLKIGFIIAFLISFNYSFSQKKIKTVLVKAGTFEMGSSSEKFKDEVPVHEVTLDAFYISQYEIPYEDYKTFCAIAGYYEPYGVDGFPVASITWERAVMMCNWLSRRDGFDRAYKIERDEKKKIFNATCNFKSNGYRLPTEAEWEYAAKGGHRSKEYTFSGSNSPFLVAWFNKTYEGLDHKSGELTPNEIGIYDMTGNVGEWCWDFYDASYYSKKSVTNPKGPKVGTTRVYRGGTRRDKMENIEVSRRAFFIQKKKNLYIGVRVVRTKLD